MANDTNDAILLRSQGWFGLMSLIEIAKFYDSIWIGAHWKGETTLTYHACKCQLQNDAQLLL